MSVFISNFHFDLVLFLVSNCGWNRIHTPHITFNIFSSFVFRHSFSLFTAAAGCLFLYHFHLSIRMRFHPIYSQCVRYTMCVCRFLFSCKAKTIGFRTEKNRRTAQAKNDLLYGFTKKRRKKLCHFWCSIHGISKRKHFNSKSIVVAVAVVGTFCMPEIFSSMLNEKDIKYNKLLIRIATRTPKRLENCRNICFFLFFFSSLDLVTTHTFRKISYQKLVLETNSFSWYLVFRHVVLCA